MAYLFFKRIFNIFLVSKLAIIAKITLGFWLSVHMTILSFSAINLLFFLLSPACFLYAVSYNVHVISNDC